MTSFSAVTEFSIYKDLKKNVKEKIDVPSEDDWFIQSQVAVKQVSSVMECLHYHSNFYFKIAFNFLITFLFRYLTISLETKI